MSKFIKFFSIILLAIAIFSVIFCFVSCNNDSCRKLMATMDSNHNVYCGDTLNSLKPYLTVIYVDENGISCKLVDYVLEGTLELGANDIAVIYEDLVCTLTVIVFDKFMSSTQVNKLVEDFGIPQAKLTLSFRANEHNYTYVITYDLLLNKTPLTVINFINLVNEGHYENAIFDCYYSSSDYYLAGRYTYRKTEESGRARGYENNSSITIPGEFKTNNYSEPKGGYEQFSMFSLAMYHADHVDAFDSANGALIFSTVNSSTQNSKSLDYTDYAVFAKMKSISIYVDDNETPITYDDGMITPTYFDNLVNQRSLTDCSMQRTDGERYTVTVLGSGSVPRFIFNIEMVDNGEDWTKLPVVAR